MCRNSCIFEYFDKIKNKPNIKPVSGAKEIPIHETIEIYSTYNLVSGGSGVSQPLLGS